VHERVGFGCILFFTLAVSLTRLALHLTSSVSSKSSPFIRVYSLMAGWYISAPLASSRCASVCVGVYFVCLDFGACSSLGLLRACVGGFESTTPLCVWATMGGRLHEVASLVCCFTLQDHG